MPKKQQHITVLDAAIDRISWTFDNFQAVYLSFSGGKDSTVMLHLAADEARKRGRRFGLLFVDLEGQYRLTIEHIRLCVEMYRDVCDVYWVCLPIHLRNAVSVFETHWVCWDEAKREAWIRNPPDDAVTDEEFFPFFGMGWSLRSSFPSSVNGTRRASCVRAWLASEPMRV